MDTGFRFFPFLSLLLWLLATSEDVGTETGNGDKNRFSKCDAGAS